MADEAKPTWPEVVAKFIDKLFQLATLIVTTYAAVYATRADFRADRAEQTAHENRAELAKMRPVVYGKTN